MLSSLFTIVGLFVATAIGVLLYVEYMTWVAASRTSVAPYGGLDHVMPLKPPEKFDDAMAVAFMSDDEFSKIKGSDNGYETLFA